MHMDTLDQHQMDSYVAMVLVSLPLPPLPVVVVKGEDRQDATCSSHDLHAVMLRTHMHMMHTNAYSHKEQLTNMDAKTKAIEDLCRNLRITLQDNPERTDEMVKQCYAHLCVAFREYASAYSHTCMDLRILPLSEVVRGDTVHQQTCAYVSAVLQDTTAPPSEDHDLTYECLLRKWLLHIESHID
jgi:hypothetical protein